jgi:hypothetical protein
MHRRIIFIIIIIAVLVTLVFLSRFEAPAAVPWLLISTHPAQRCGTARGISLDCGSQHILRILSIR